jgi:membrane protease YdiL (CAAX protease family)
MFKYPLFVPLVLYILFFPPDSGLTQLLAPAVMRSLSFSVSEAIFQSFTFYIPASSVVLYFYLQDTPDLQLKKSPRVTCTGIIKFIFHAVSGAVALLLIGGFIVFVEGLFPGMGFPAPDVEMPYSAAAIPTMLFYWICAAYLEESFFRALLYGRLLLSGVKKIPAAVISAVFFALCHAWEGHWGMAGAFLSGLFLSFMFERKKSLDCITASHALYNITVYLL